MRHDIILYHVEHTTQQIANTGIQRVVRGLAKAMIQDGRTVIPVCFDRMGFTTVSRHGLEILSMFDGPSVESWGDLGELEKLIPKAKLLIVPELFTPADSLIDMVSFCRRNRIVSSAVFHDAIPTLMPEWYREGASLHKEYIKGLSLCDHVFSVSNSSSNDFKLVGLDVYGQYFAKVHTVYLPNIFLDFPKIKEKENNTKEIEILCVSTVEVRKNHVSLIKAFINASEKLSKDGYSLKLNLVGIETQWWQATRAVDTLMLGRKDIVWHKKVSDEELIKLYESADFSAYPSIYEGYGLPVSESLYLNTPVICSNNSSVAEVASQGGCITFDPYDVKDIEDKIVMMATNPDLRKEKVAEAAKIKRKSWKKYSDEILSIVEDEVK